MRIVYNATLPLQCTPLRGFQYNGVDISVTGRPKRRSLGPCVLEMATKYLHQQNSWSKIESGKVVFTELQSKMLPLLA
eukprot:scaffold179540_cov19-Tisochrysis_lutea.AAC.2